MRTRIRYVFSILYELYAKKKAHQNIFLKVSQQKAIFRYH